jgi:hypothetical protein
MLGGSGGLAGRPAARLGLSPAKASIMLLLGTCTGAPMNWLDELIRGASRMEPQTGYTDAAEIIRVGRINDGAVAAADR